MGEGYCSLFRELRGTISLLIVALIFPCKLIIHNGILVNIKMFNLQRKLTHVPVPPKFLQNTP